MEIVKTLLKVLVIVIAYLGVAPVIAAQLKGRDRPRRMLLGFMVWWLVRPRSDFTLMLYSIDTYRGHARGFEFNWIEVIAIGFALAALLEKRKDFRWFPPGLWMWLLWVAAGMLSVPGALNPLYALMPAFKFLKMGFVLLGVFAALHDERDVRAVMKGFSVALIMQVILCLWGRYVQGGFRVTGWFEHQNPMAMWSYMVALPILALAITKQTPVREMILYFAAYGSAGLVVVLSVSRASLAAFAVGTALVLIGSFLNGVTLRRVLLSSLLAVGGVLVMAKAADTFMARMGNDDSPKNDLRYALNKQAAAMFADRPVAGIGWNNFGLANSRPLGMKYSAILEKWEQDRGRTIYAKNFVANPLTESFYWLILAENGLAGIIAYFSFALLTLWFGLRSSVEFWKSPLGLFFYAVTVALAVTYFHGQVERVLTQTKNLTTWIVFCAILSRGEWWRRQAKAGRKARLRAG